MTTRTFTTLLFAALLLGAPLPLVAADATEEIPLAAPTADFTGEDVVSLDDVLAAARWVAAERWGAATPGEPLPCVDMEGRIVCWMVPFRRDGGDFPSRADLLAEVRDDTRLEKSGVGAFAPPYADGGTLSRELLDGAVEEPSGEGRALPTVRPDGEISHRLQYRLAKRDHDRRLREAAGAERYGTVVVAARGTMHPLIAVYWSLPPYYLSGPEAAGKAGAVLNDGTAALTDIVFLSPGEIYYRFSGADDRALVHAKSLQVVEDETAVRDRARSLPYASPDKSARDENVRIWNELLALAR